MTAPEFNAYIAQLQRDIEHWQARYDHADCALRGTGVTARIFYEENLRDRTQARAKLERLRGVCDEMQLRLRVLCNQAATNIGDNEPYSGEEVAL